MPDFSSYVNDLVAMQEATKRLQEVTSSGRQLCYLAMARLQRADTDGAASVLAELAALTPPSELTGELWANPERRLELCLNSGYGYFCEMYNVTLCFNSFLDKGVLTASAAGSWKSGIEDYDDELYLLGTIGASREIERYAVNRGQRLDLASIKLCLGAVQSLEEALMQFSFRNSDLRQRFDGIKYCVKRLESLAYEISLALQRAAASSGAMEVEEPAVPSLDGGIPGGSASEAAIDIPLIASMKERYETYDAQREQVMKQARDVIKAAKNAVYALQRADYKRADGFLAECSRDAVAIYGGIVTTYPRLRDGLFSASLEEFAEALSYRAFRKDQKLLSFEEMQEASGLQFKLTIVEYLGGIMDLTGEVGRLAIRSAGKGRQGRDTVTQCLACVDAVYNGVQALPQLPGKLSKKIGPLKGTLSKIEVALYELALLSQGVKSTAAPALDPEGGEA